MPPKTLPVHPFDALHGTDTGGLIPGAALATGTATDAHVTAYYAIAPSILDGLIDVWQRTRPLFAIDRYSFLDVGAGKGRALMTASLHPFQAVVGIERNPGLAAIARANLQRFAASPHAAPLAPCSVVEADALDAALPATPTLAFLFHPFEAPVLRRFLARVAEAFRGQPGHFDLLYVNAEHSSVMDRTPGFTRLFNGMIPMSPDDHRADLLEIAEQKEYGSTGDEFCTLYRYTGAA